MNTTLERLILFDFSYFLFQGPRRHSPAVEINLKYLSITTKMNPPKRKSIFVLYKKSEAFHIFLSQYCISVSAHPPLPPIVRENKMHLEAL